MNLLLDARAGLTMVWSFAGHPVAHDAEAACNRALGYPVPSEPVDAPVPVLTLQDADLASRSLDPTGGGRARWVMRWKSPLNAFAISFAGRFEGTTH